MKILHTGDFHLDSAFAGLDITRAQDRRRELRDTFSRMMRAAKKLGVDMVVIAGDLFDGAFVTRDTVALLIKEFSALSCPVIITPGNHDYVSENSVWMKTVFPENVHIFKTASLEKISFDSLSCDVYGYAFTSQSYEGCPIGSSVENRERINILVGHGDTVSPISRYAALPVSVLRDFGADYAALGHIHNPESANAALEGVGAYCGCPEGRDFGETGEKGAYIVTVEKGVYKKEFLRFCKRVYDVRELNVDTAGDNSFITEAVSRFVRENAYGEDSLLRIVLTGSVEPSLVINTGAVAEEVGGLYYLEIEDSTVPTWSAGDLQNDPGIRGEVYRTLLPALESSDKKERETASLALRYALCALMGEDVSNL